MQDSSGASDRAERLKPAVMTLRIIVLALASGVVAFAVAAIMIRQQQGPAPGGDAGWLLTTLGIAAAPVAMFLSRFVPGLFVAKARAQIASGQYGFPGGSNPGQASGPQSNPAPPDDAALFGVFQSQTIIAAALIEGAAFFNIVAFMLGGSPVSLCLGLLLALTIAALFPRMSRVVEWIDGQRRLIAEEKLLVR